MFSLSLLDKREVEAHLRECLLPISSLRACCLAEATYTLQTGPVEWEKDRQRGGVSERESEQESVCETQTGWIPLFLWHSTGAHEFI